MVAIFYYSTDFFKSAGIEGDQVQLWQHFFCIRPPPGLLSVLGPLTRYMTPTLDAALIYVVHRDGVEPLALGRVLTYTYNTCLYTRLIAGHTTPTSIPKNVGGMITI